MGFHGKKRLEEHTRTHGACPGDREKRLERFRDPTRYPTDPKAEIVAPAAPGKLLLRFLPRGETIVITD